MICEGVLPWALVLAPPLSAAWPRALAKKTLPRSDTNCQANIRRKPLPPLPRLSHSSPRQSRLYKLLVCETELATKEWLSAEPAPLLVK